ncbi:hypothetical protein DES36_11932 [Alkalibaculum bacchi]|uniref:Uncharacterized protein n=1 Tax=Alkalibaculum bacchi TaxID=645887 RepID=A0A366HZC1_9FIRM|nr:hypothetical protein [Alkalibaculum bacchi]RBP59307.1 hypothetical protein DES36_11932 [Alkalibaculum bacchi]
MINLILHDNRIVIRLINGDNKVVFMRYPYSYKENCQLAFVKVDTLKKYWIRNNYDEHSKYANASEYELRQDYKFKYAEEGFSRGDKDPVPVAEIALLSCATLPCIGFQNGITRTIWLIANGYKVIPFEVANVTSEFLLDEGVYSFK